MTSLTDLSPPSALTGRLSGLRRRRPSAATTAVVGVASLALAVAALATAVDSGALAASFREMADQPVRVTVALTAFALAFAIRAGVWRRVLPDLPFGHALAALHVSLGANHVLPLRLGEPLRVVSVVRRTDTSVSAATASTLTLRAADLVAVTTLGLVLAPATFAQVLGPWGWAILGGVAAVGVAGLVWLVRLVGRGGTERIRLPGPAVALGTTAAWLAESILVWQCARFAGLDVGYGQAVLVTTAAVAAQMVAIAPSGVGTYEAASVAAYVALGFDAGPALVAAIGAHALKTAYSLVTGAAAVIVPSPGFWGRLRLTQRPTVVALPADDVPPPVTVPPAPVVLFLPAHDEAASVGDVVRRCPAAVAGHPVRCLVIDDGSTDETAARGRAAGAEVLVLPENQGLGAGVRTGLAWAVAQGCAAVAFCDADGEYAPEELERLVSPVLAGDADYVVGSRFSGDIRSMRPHRRLGNVVLTRLLRLVARAPITDGQSGYRAFSPAAAADAEVIHDFNYAQVLTLDLLGKGYRYAEVPITYAFRTEGTSFIRLGHYLRAVIPAVWRELNDGAGAGAVAAPIVAPT